MVKINYDKKLLEQRVREGKTNREIGEEFGVCEGSIANYVKEQGLQGKRKIFGNDRGRNLKGRAKTRGRKMDDDCKTAHATKEHKGYYCYGIKDKMKEEAIEKCKECKAYVDNM